MGIKPLFVIFICNIITLHVFTVTFKHLMLNKVLFYFFLILQSPNI